ncbi:RnfABCDGE type electron transport complex subunit D [Oscillospiraceae bacterium MB08-C2-2]|nr:RnfABCDGE type electron transport complex subunit D [Oscillospiraceae bacterium MB08-C2-2]
MKTKSIMPPHIRHGESTRTLSVNTMLALSFVYAMALFFYGPRAVALGVVSVVTCVITELLCLLLARKKINIRDYSSIITGMVLPLMMPASIAYHIVVVAGIFAIAVVKHPFGGTGQNVFNPAAGGFAFVVVSFGDKLFQYPLPLERMDVLADLSGKIFSSSPAYTLGLGGRPQYEALSMLLGNFPGPMGATNILVILACLLYLVFRNTVHWTLPISFLSTVAAYSWLFPRLIGGRSLSVVYEMTSGILLFGGVFLLGDPVTTPKRNVSKLVYGVSAGIVVMLFRRYGGYEEEFAFALLLLNAAVWPIDMLIERISSKVRRKRFESESASGKKLPKKA